MVPFSEHGARGPVEGDLPRHQIGAWWMIVEGGGDNGIKGIKSVWIVTWWVGNRGAA